MPADLTVTDAQGRGWTVRFLDQKEWTAFKRHLQFGKSALKAERLKSNWPDSAAFEGALAYFESRIVHFKPADTGKWLKQRELSVVRL